MRTDWPGGAEVAVSLTFDVDAESGLAGERSRVRGAAEHVERGAVRRHARPAADPRDPRPARDQGHVLRARRHRRTAHRRDQGGHRAGPRDRPSRVPAQAERRDRRRSSRRRRSTRDPRAQGRLDVTPTGYRSPSWELTPETLALLKHYGFTYDSSLMGDDRPYMYDGLLELPVHWSLDDWPHLHWKPGRGDAFTAPEAFLDTWLSGVRLGPRGQAARHVHDASGGDRPRVSGATARPD